MRVKSQMFTCNCPEPADGGVDAKVGEIKPVFPTPTTESPSIYVTCPVCGECNWLLNYSGQIATSGWHVNGGRYDHGDKAMARAAELLQAGTSAHIYAPSGVLVASIFPPKD